MQELSKWRSGGCEHLVMRCTSVVGEREKLMRLMREKVAEWQSMDDGDRVTTTLDDASKIKEWWSWLACRDNLEEVVGGHRPFLEGPSGNRYILVVGDYFTKWMEAYAVPDQETTTVVRKLVDEFFCHFSVPVAYIQAKENSLRPNLSLLSASYYRLTSPRLPHTTHSLMGLLNGSIVRLQTYWQPLRRSTPLNEKGTCREGMLCIQYQCACINKQQKKIPSPVVCANKC